MIAGIFHQGSGLGNQLFRYVMTRTLALDKGYDWTMVNWENFKGSSFMNIPMKMPSKGQFEMKYWEEKKVVENGVDIRSYDPEINFVEDDTVIDGEFQDERYWKHRLDEVREWLKVEPLEMPDDLCIVNIRGGEYKIFPDLFLPLEYWEEAMFGYMKNMRFEIHTDDLELANKWFPHIPAVHDIGLNWRSIRYAKHLILSNSSFAILPALLNQNCQTIIAPKYWGRHNTKVWALPQNYYSRFTYL